MRFISISLLLLSIPAIAIAGGDPIAGKNKVVLCIGCHGVDGNGSSSLFPKLAGQGEAYLTKQLHDFKTGARKEEHMTSMVENVAIADIPDIVAYFAGLPRSKENPGTKDIAAGRLIYESGIQASAIPACASCHGKDGQGNTAANYPALAGQYGEYIVKALQDFRGAARSNDPQGVMRNIATKLSDQEIVSIANYLSGLR